MRITRKPKKRYKVVGAIVDYNESRMWLIGFIFYDKETKQTNPLRLDYCNSYIPQTENLEFCGNDFYLPNCNPKKFPTYDRNGNLLYSYLPEPLRYLYQL